LVAGLRGIVILIISIKSLTQIGLEIALRFRRLIEKSSYFFYYNGCKHNAKNQHPHGVALKFGTRICVASGKVHIYIVSCVYLRKSVRCKIKSDLKLAGVYIYQGTLKITCSLRETPVSSKNLDYFSVQCSSVAGCGKLNLLLT
jgi:hypothetical protein